MACGYRGVLISVTLYGFLLMWSPFHKPLGEHKYEQSCFHEQGLPVHDVLNIQNSLMCFYKSASVDYAHEKLLLLTPYNQRGTCNTTLRKSSNFFLSLCLLLCGDVHPCPGPGPRYPCAHCGKAVRSNSHAISCDSCDNWVHVKCSSIKSDQYTAFVSSGEECSFLCDNSLWSVLPFADLQLHDEEPINLACVRSYDDENPPVDPSIFDCFKTRGLHFLHLNARSLLPHLEELKLIAHKSNAAVIGISETWLDDSVSDTEVSIPNYIILRCDRNRNGGGACMFIRSDIAFNPRLDLHKDGIEMVYADLLLPKSRPILVGVGYRPPKKSTFFEQLEECFMNTTFNVNSELYLLGDFNCDVSNLSTRNCLIVVFQKFCNLFDLTQIIQDFTRVTSISQSIIDLILVSDCDKVPQSMSCLLVLVVIS